MASTDMVGGEPARRVTVASRLDRLPLFSLHRRLALVCGVGTFFDLYDVFLGGVLAAVLAEEWGLSTAGKALVIASGFMGMFVGAIALGTLSDYLGRRRMFLVNLGVYSAFTLAAAASPNLAWLAVLRFCAGLGLGAELTLVDTYMSELIPRQARGRYIAWSYTFGFIGVPLVAFIGARFVAGHHLLMDGWRWLLVVGSLGAAIVWALRRSLPESPRWHEIRGELAEADEGTARIERACVAERGLDHLSTPEAVPVAGQAQATVREIFSPRYRRRTVMLWIFQVLQTVGYYGFGTLAPLVLTAKGFDITETLGYSALIYLGYPIGSALSVPLVERFERKTLIVASSLAMGALGVAFGFARTPALIVVAGFALTSVSNVFSNSFHIYMPEIFPTRMRGTAVGIAYSLSRATGAVLPFISVAVLDSLGATAVFVGSAVIMCVLALDVGILGPRSTGRNLEHVARDGGEGARELRELGAVDARVGVS